MKKYGVDLNSASNGVFLPDAPDLKYAGGATIHKGSHTTEYARYVARYLIEGNPQSTSDIAALINDLREELLNGMLRLN